jgi:hypothetical protein
MDLPVRHSVRGTNGRLSQTGSQRAWVEYTGKKTNDHRESSRAYTDSWDHLLEPTRQLQRSARRMTAWGECRSGDSATGGTARFARRNRTGRGPTWRATVKFCERQPGRWWQQQARAAPVASLFEVFACLFGSSWGWLDARSSWP